MDDFSMSDKILRRIEDIIKNDNQLIDFAIVPTEDNTRNKSPVLYEEHHLGLESWCVKHIYQHVCSELFKVRPKLRNRKLPFSVMEDLNYLLIGALLINPDVTTFWNLKRELVEADILNFDGEMQFTKIVLSHKSKSTDAFSYRRWLLKRLVDKQKMNNLRPSLHLFREELAVTHMAAERTPNNYHAWTHCIWCIELIRTYLFSSNDWSFLMDELDYAHNFVREHVSEHSSFHYLGYLIRLFKHHKSLRLLSHYYRIVGIRLNLNPADHNIFAAYLLGNQATANNGEDDYTLVNYLCVLFIELFVVIKEIEAHYPNHESVWNFRRFVLSHLWELWNEYNPDARIEGSKTIDFPSKGNIVRACSSNIANISGETGEKLPKQFKSQSNKVKNSNLYRILASAEKAVLSENKSEVARVHQVWLRNILGMEI